MAFDAFLKIDGIPGECTDQAHKNWIELLSFSHQIMQPATGSVSTGGARSAERCDHQDFVIVKALDKSSPKLALKCSNGEHIPRVTIQLCRNTGSKNTYMEVIMHDVIISSYSPIGRCSGEESLPIEDLSLNYGKIEWIYTEMDHKTGKPKGNVRSNWDLVENRGA